MGDAFTHQTIEMKAWGVVKPNLTELEKVGGIYEFKQNFRDLTEDQKQALHVYCGNWMRDFSQLFVPVVLESTAKFPKYIEITELAKVVDGIAIEKKSEEKKTPSTIGPEGADKLLYALLRALAAMEFGEESEKPGKKNPLDMIIPNNIRMYLPEEHMDNPAGLSFGDFLIRDEKGVYITADKASKEMLQEQLGASAFEKQKQAENQNLYGLSATGLAIHIYNTSEWVKVNFLEAAKAKDDYDLRMLFGKGLHGVEDYFGHSNFVEVALNIIIEDANKLDLPEEFKKLRLKKSRDSEGMGRSKIGIWVDTMFNKGVETIQQPGTAKKLEGRMKRYPITTGTFLPLDTKVSIVHGVLPMLPKMQIAIDASIDKMFKEIEKKSKKVQKWEDIEKPENVYTWKDIQNEAKTDRKFLLTKILLEGFNDAGIKLQIYELEKMIIKKEIPKPLDLIIPDKILILVSKGIEIPIGITTKYVEPTYILEFCSLSYNYFQWISLIISQIPEKILILILGTDNTKKLKDLIKYLKENLGKILAETIKNAIKRSLFMAIEKLLCIKGKEDKRENSDEWQKVVKDKVTTMVPKTSLQVLPERIKEIETGVSDLFLCKNKRDLNENEKRWKKKEVALIPPDPENQLPPSHSEICKDHPPHLGNHELDKGSLFYYLHFELAQNAVEHLTVLMENKVGKSIVNRKKVMPNEQVRKINNDAKNLSIIFKKEIKKSKDKNIANRKYANDENIDFLELLNAVDLYISHPSDTQWWRSIVVNYIKNNGDEVYKHIKLRNKMLSERK